MSDRTPASGDADDQRGSEPDMSATDEFAKMRAVMRASEKHREVPGLALRRSAHAEHYGFSARPGL